MCFLSLRGAIKRKVAKIENTRNNSNPLKWITSSIQMRICQTRTDDGSQISDFRICSVSLNKISW